MLGVEDAAPAVPVAGAAGCEDGADDVAVGANSDGPVVVVDAADWAAELCPGSLKPVKPNGAAGAVVVVVAGCEDDVLAGCAPRPANMLDVEEAVVVGVLFCC